MLLTTAEPQQQYAVWQPVEEGGEGLVYGLMLNPERPLFADDRVRRALLSDLPDDCPRRLVPESMWDTGEQLDFPQMNSDEMRQMYLEGAAAAGGSEGLTVLISESRGCMMPLPPSRRSGSGFWAVSRGGTAAGTGIAAAGGRWRL